jgi:hypothetical protein
MGVMIPYSYDGHFDSGCSIGYWGSRVKVWLQIFGLIVSYQSDTHFFKRLGLFGM